MLDNNGTGNVQTRTLTSVKRHQIFTTLTTSDRSNFWFNMPNGLV